MVSLSAGLFGGCMLHQQGFSQRNTFRNDLLSRVGPPEKTGRCTLFAHREHQVWLRPHLWTPHSAVLFTELAMGTIPTLQRARPRAVS